MPNSDFVNYFTLNANKISAATTAREQLDADWSDLVASLGENDCIELNKTISGGMHSTLYLRVEEVSKGTPSVVCSGFEITLRNNIVIQVSNFAHATFPYTTLKSYSNIVVTNEYEMVSAWANAVTGITSGLTSPGGTTDQMIFSVDLKS